MKVLLIFTSVCFFLLDQGLSDGGSDVVKTEIGKSVTLHTGVKNVQQDRIRWYFNDIRLFYINGTSAQLICTDAECKEKFRDRLKLDSQTGSLTITDTRTTDSGDYTLLDSTDNEKIYKVLVTGKTLSVTEGDPVTLDLGETENTKETKTWRYKDTLIAELNGSQSKICEEVQCKERFRDRVNLDNQTGSLTISNTRTNDSGEYNLVIGSGSRRQRRSIDTVTTFVVTVSARKDSVASPGVPVVVPVVAVVVPVVAVLLVASAIAGVIYRHRSSRKRDMEENQEPLRTTNSEKEEDKDQMT